MDDFRVPSRTPPSAPGSQPRKVAARVRPSHNGIPPQVFEPKDIDMLRSPTARLNDVCINSCAILLWYSQWDTSTQIAMLSTHDLPRIRYNAPDDVIWRNASWVRYWDKDTWVLPIHRPSVIGHWVLCVIRLSHKELHLFDSLGDRKPWPSDVKVS